MDNPKAKMLMMKRDGRAGFVVPVCPFCRQRHYHDGGPLGADVWERIGPVESACDPSRKYRLYPVAGMTLPAWGSTVRDAWPG